MYQNFLAGEVRFVALKKSFPQESEILTARLEAEVNARNADLKRMAELPVIVEEQTETETAPIEG
jgi:hypothetical protein